MSNVQTSNKTFRTDMDYTDYNIDANTCDNYIITDILGKGKYSIVFLGIDKITKKKVVIKTLKPIKQQKINREVFVLKNIGKHKNVIELLDVTYDKQTKTYSLIFDYIEHTESYETLKNMNNYKEIVKMCKNVLLGISHIHKHGIMHRDIKPGNLILNTKTQELKIIDFGLAELLFPDKNYCVRVSTKSYKAPELLMDNEYYGFPIDIWSFGTIIGETITQRQPFFQNKKSDNILCSVVKILGKADLIKCLKKYNLEHNDFTKEAMGVEDAPNTKIDFVKFNYKKPSNEEEHKLLYELVKVMEMCLRYDPS